MVFHNSLKGQSAIEYLTTYGWMLIVVAVAGGTVFTTIQNNSEVKKSSGFVGSNIEVEDFGITSSGDLKMVLRAAASDDVEVSKVKLSDEDNPNLKAVNSSQMSIPVAQTDVVSLDNVQKSENSNTYEVTVTYDVGNLENLQTQGTITGPIEIVEIVVEKLLASGGEIQSIDIQSSLRSNSSQPLCMGEYCPTTDGESLSDTEKYVNRSGDEMTGTLKVDKVQFDCLGNNCSVNTGSLSGYVSNVNNTMDGTLNATEVKPVNKPLCLGGNC